MARKKDSRKAADSRPTLDGRKVHRIVFVTGKGGVGKSAVAAATALQFARAGKTVLLVELGSRSFYGPLLGLPVGAATVPWTSSIGQFMALMRAPRGISQTAASGPMHRHTADISALLCDPAICEYRLVTLAEEMPTAEACEMARELRAETGIAPRIYCNRLIDLPPQLPAWPPGDPAAPFIRHMARVAARQRKSLRLLQALGDDCDGPVRRLPWIPVTDAQRLLQALADALDADPGALP